ncbi:3-keto-5-aminohexanoate cleavage protein [Clostridium estertheticum]|uniref:3-keto-5-aminohexanoate cleavage protein n=1 Tax=Clostridium estertheticum TaxID=238834 RepID=A0AA47EQA7_9CLOT|nr:3-keto-5-aminohexanoate cleavage protein [Clostridium estertheticum]MBU3156642.1 3-keto-5-aminohexanoate cleavage protein [Clostridium estertheticum]WAG62778.1 3-keto-5-aminohexanoate cleavage protein [Clostridium estertheticum]
MKNKVLLTVATTGAWPQKKDTPYIPLQPEEIADEICACAKAGASIAHIHVRDDENQASMSFEKFEKTVKLVRKSCDIVINLTTSGGIGLTDDIRIKPFSVLKPEMASFDCGSMNWQNSTVFENSPKFLEKAGTAMQENNVKPEIEVFDAGMVYNALYYLKKGFLKAPLHFQFVLGVPGGMTATVENLMFLKSLIPVDSTWGALGIGKQHLPIMYAALALGGNLRVGMEDNIYYRFGELAKSNVDFIERTKRIVTELDKEIATPAEARIILGLKNC